jgi:hypothetical protein
MHRQTRQLMADRRRARARSATWKSDQRATLPARLDHVQSDEGPRGETAPDLSGRKADNLTDGAAALTPWLWIASRDDREIKD